MPVPVLSAQSPSLGRISWPAFSIQYGGVAYGVPAFNTDKKFTWWKFNGGSPSVNVGNVLPDGRLQNNLLPNYDFSIPSPASMLTKTGAEWWQSGAGFSYAASGRSERILSPNRRGSFAMKMTTGPGVDNALDSAGFGFNGSVTVAPGDIVSLEVELTSIDATPVNAISIRYVDQAGTERFDIGFENVTYSNGLTGVIVQRTFTVPAGVTSIRLQVLVHAPGAGSNKTLFVESLRLGIGAIEPPMTPDDCLLFLNKNGVPLSVQAATVIDGSIIATESIYANAIAANQITAEHILAGAIKAVHIEAGSIETTKLAARSITADKLEANVLAAGFVLTGSLQVGTSFWNPNQGFVIPGVVTLSPAGAFITAAMTATSLTVQKDLLIQGSTNQIKGALNVADGISTPTELAAMSYGWNTLGPARPTPYGNISYGLTPHLTDTAILLMVDSFYTSGISSVLRSTGGPTPFPLYTGVKSWTDNLSLFGITTAGGFYWVLARTNSGPENWYVLKIDSSYEQVARYPISFYTSGQVFTSNWAGYGRPAINADSSGNIMVAYANGADAINVNFLSIANGTWLGTISSYPYPSIGVNSLGYVGIGTFDFGVTRVLFTIDGFGTVAYEGAVRASAYDFQLAGSTTSRGMWFDGTRFWSAGLDAVLRTHGINPSIHPTSASYTWYDGDVSSGSIAHESSASPDNTFFRPARTTVTITTPLAPDSGITAVATPADRDKANKVRVYVALGKASRRLQGGGDLGVDANGVTNRMLTLDALNTATVIENSSGVASFASAANSPGLLQSAAGSSTAGWQMFGNGNANFSGILGGRAFLSSQVYLGGTANQNFTGTANVAVTNMTVNVDSPGPGGSYEIIFGSWMLPGNGHTQIVGLLVDGTEQAQVGVAIGSASGSAGTYTFIWRVTGLSAGSHTFSLRSRMAAAGQTGGFAGASNTNMTVKRMN